MKIVFKQLILVGSLLAIGVQPAFAQELERGKDGTLACVGNHDVRRGGSEITFTSYTFRNFNPDNAITIDSITIFAADGTVLRNMALGSFPAGFNNVVGPNQTANLTTRDVFGDSNISPPAPTPLQTIVKWTATSRGSDLYANAARQDRERNPVNGANLAQRARGLIRCVSLK